MDITQISDEKIKQLQWVGVMEFVQKHIFARDFLRVIEDLVPLLKILEEKGAQEYLLATVHYFLHSNTDDREKVVKIFGDNLSRKTGDDMMTLAERLDLRGYEQGRVEAELAARRQIAAQLLEENADPTLVAKVTGLSLEIIQTLAKAAV